MSTDLWPEGYDRVVHETVDSTNAEGVRVAPFLHRPTWIMAHQQTKARGRRGKGWVNPAGNLAASLVMRPGGVPAWAALRSFLAANALFETLALFVPREALSVKWPNDVLLNERKVAGILLESAGNAKTVDWLVIGFGVNLNETPVVPDAQEFPPISVKEVSGDSVDTEEFLDMLAGHYATEERILDTLGFEPIRQDWLERAARLGDTIAAQTANKKITGIFDSIDEEGQLVLITGTGPVHIAAADVYF
ncbi:MAG: biotin--[acetyl-CoA-carboxylase] ligase [Pseudomonadota bacterium]